MEEKNHYELFKEADARYKIILKYDKYYLDENLLFSFMSDFKVVLHDNIYKILSPEKHIIENENFIRYYCDYINKNILPLCNNKLASLKRQIEQAYEIGDKIENINGLQRRYNDWIHLEDDFYAMSCYRNLTNFAFYMERGKPLSKRVWNKTMPIFEGLFNYMQQMVFDEGTDLIRASYFPGAGKTFAGNLLCAFWIGYDTEITILRITYSDDLVESFTGQIQNIMGSGEFKKVFPFFDKQDKDLYKKKNTDTIWLKNSTGVNFYARTRDGQATGKRAKVLMIDDITKGQAEAYKIALHVSIVNRYDMDWNSRADDENQKIVLLGTMWSRFDLLNVIQQRDEAKGNLVEDEKYKYTKKNFDGTSVYISVPALDYETDESTCPLRYSTEFFRDKREKAIDKPLFNAVYQQAPEEPEEIYFGYTKLHTYTAKNFPKQILDGDYQCRAMIDPNRRAFDFFVLAILKRYEIEKGKWSKWYFVDCICRKKQFKQLKEEITNKLIKNNVSHLGVEINTSNELGDTIKDLLKAKDYKDIEIYEEYSVDNKADKINTYKDDIISEIIFPSKNMFASSSDMGCAMDWLTTYNLEGKNDHDDVPDCFSMFVKINNQNESSKNETIILKKSCRF